MAAILIGIQPGDEVIVPSYTFVSTANAFVLHGASVVFADSMPNNPNIDASKIEELITPRTKAIVIVHYGGVACDMDAIMTISQKHNLIVIEDAAQAIDSYFNDKPLGSIGHYLLFLFMKQRMLSPGKEDCWELTMKGLLKDQRLFGRKELTELPFGAEKLINITGLTLDLLSFLQK